MDSGYTYSVKALKRYPPLLASILLSLFSCELLYGPKVDMNIDIEHISSSLASNTGIGNDWADPEYSINGKPFDPARIGTFRMSSWDDLRISCRYTELDEVYSDNGVGVFEMPLYRVLKTLGDDFALTVFSTVCEQRSANYSTNGDHANWQDIFHIVISDAE